MKRERTIKLYGKITENCARQFKAAVKELDVEPFPPMRVIINSPGGDWRASLEMHHVLHNTESHVTTIGTDVVRSGALLVLQGGDERLASGGCKLTFHRVNIGLNRFLKDHLINAEALLVIWKELSDIDSMAKYILTSRATSAKPVLEYFKRDASISSRQAKKIKIIDGIWQEDKP